VDKELVSDKEREDLLNKLEKEIGKEFSNLKLIFAIGLVATGIYLLLRLHEFNQIWAWELAKVLITINGLILGFTIVGVTLSSERPPSEINITKIFSQHVKETISQLKVVELANPKETEKKLHSSLLDAIAEFVFEVYIIPFSMISAIRFLAVSILFALLLFGISDSTVNNVILREFFGMMMLLSIAYLILGMYYTFKGLKHVTACD